MTTLRDLQYQVEANTAGLNKAFPVLEKLVKTLGQLDKTVNSMAGNYEAQMKRVAAASTGAATTATKSIDAQRLALRKQNDLVKEAKQRVTELNAAMKAAGGMGSAMGGNIRSLQAFEKAMKSGALSAYDLAVAKKRLNAVLGASDTVLKNFNAATLASAKATKVSEAALLRQETALSRAQIKYDNLVSAMKKMKAPQTELDKASTAFAALQAAMKSGPLTTAAFTRASNAFSAELAVLKRNAGAAHPELEKLGLDVKSLTKALQVALGPLSGVASRITALAAFTKGSTVAIAGLVGGLVAFGTGLVLAIKQGAEFETQYNRIQAVLDATGNQIGMTAQEVINVTENLGLANESVARDAAASLLSMRGITKDLYGQALLAAQGLSLIGRGDVASQIRRVGKILTDPTNNMKALTESGVQFNDVEERTITLLQRSGDLHGAQAKVLSRLNTVIEAGKGETRGFAGAWDELTDTIRNAVLDTTRQSGAMSALTQVVKDVNTALKDFGDSTQAAIQVGNAYRITIQAVGGTLVFLAKHLKFITALFIVLIGMKIGGVLLGIAASFRTMAISAGIAETAIKGVQLAMLRLGLIGAAFAILGGLWSRFSEDTKVATDYVSTFADKSGKGFEDVRKHMDNMTNGSNWLERGLIKLRNMTKLPFAPNLEQDSLDAINQKFVVMVDNIKGELTQIGKNEIKLPNTDAAKKQLEDVQEAFARIKNEIAVANAAGRPADVSQSDLQTVYDNLSKSVGGYTKNLAAAAAAVRRYLPANRDMKRDAKAFAPELEEVAQNLLTLRGSFSKLSTEQDAFTADQMNMAQNMDLFKKVIASTAKDAFPLYGEELERIVLEHEKVSTSLASLQTDMENQVAASQSSIAITQADGKAKADLSDKQAILNALIQSGIFITSDWAQNLKTLTPAMKAAMEQVIALQKALEGNRRADALEQTIKDQRTSLDTAKLQAAVAIQSDEAQAVALARLAKTQELLAQGQDESSKKFKDLVDGAEQLVHIDYATQILKANKLLDDQLVISRAGLGLAHSLTAARDEELARLQDINEMMEKNGKVDETMLKHRAELRQLDRDTDQQLAIKALDDTIAAMERQVSLAGENSEKGREEVAILKDKIELANKYGKINEEELSRRAQIRDLQRSIDFGEEVRASQQAMVIQDKTAQTMFQTEGTRSRAVALAEKEYEVGQKYVRGVLDPRAQKELALFKQIQDREAYIEKNIKPLADAWDSVFSNMEESFSSFLETGKLDFSAFARSVLADIAKIMAKSLIFDPLKDSLGGMLGNMVGLPGGAGGAAGLTGLGTMANPMWVKMVDAIPGLGGGVGAGLSAPALPGATGLLNAPVGKVTSVDLPPLTGDQTAKIQKSLVDAISPYPAGTISRADLPPLPGTNAANPIWSEAQRASALASAGGLRGTMPGGIGGATIGDMGLRGTFPGGTGGALASGSMPAGLTDVQSQIWQYWANKGLQPHQISGIMGNIGPESGFNPAAEQFPGKNFGGKGLFQWDDRGPAMQAAVPDWRTNVQGQMDYAYGEFMGPEKRSWDRLMGSTDVTGATNAVMGFERPKGFTLAHPEYGSQYANRQDTAQNFMDQSTGASMADGGGIDAINKLTEQTTALADAQTKAVSSMSAVPSAANSLVSSVDTASQAAQNLGTSGVNQAITGLTATGTASVTAAASLNNLSSSALSAGAQSAATSGMGGLFHSGGIVGAGTPAMRAVSNSGYAGPRLGKGLLPDEFKAILHRGEAVFNRDQLDTLGEAINNGDHGHMVDDGKPRASRAGGGGIHVHLHGVTDFDTFKKSESQLRASMANLARKADFANN